MDFRRRYFHYLEAGGGDITGDQAAQMALDDLAQDELGRFISEQPAHNAPIPYDELRDSMFGDQGEDGDEPEPEPDYSHTRNDPLCWGQ